MPDDREITYKELGTDDYLSVMTGFRLIHGKDRDRWAIKRGNECLPKIENFGNVFFFEIESMPSSRDDHYYNYYRFYSAEEAYQFWLDNRGRIIATPQEQYEFGMELRERVVCMDKEVADALRD